MSEGAIVTDETKDLHDETVEESAVEAEASDDVAPESAPADAPADAPEDAPEDVPEDAAAPDLGADDLFAFGDGAAEEEPSADEAPAVDAAPAEGDDDAAPAAPAELTEQERIEEEKRRKGMRWYVIHANTGHENKVKRNIEMAIKANAFEDVFGEVLVATQDVTEMKNGRRVTSKRKFFPSYVLVEMVMSKETQHFINSIPGVTRFIGGTQLKPQPISREEVDRILGRMNKTEETGTLLEIPYQVGDSVQVIDGPFSDWVGVINEINHDKGKLKVMISIFGSETPVELDFLQVKDV